VFGNHDDPNTTLGQGTRRGKTDKTTADDDNVLAQFFSLF
jgi:hypothetical protein